MKNVLGGLLVFCLMLVSVHPVSAIVPSVYTNANFFLMTHDKPVSFTQDPFGNFSGFTESGKYFTQRTVTSSVQVRLQRFAIDEAHFYVSNLGVIEAETDTIALSIYLARAGWEDVV
jgi:hypothetical protein